MNLSKDWQLIDGEQRKRASLFRVEVPPREAREAVKIGDLVVVGLEPLDGDPVLAGGERMWVEVTHKNTDTMEFFGEVRQHPKNTARHNLKYGDEIEFGPEHILKLDGD